MSKYSMNMTDAYRQIVEEQELDHSSSPDELNEIRVLRGASALVFAQKSRTAGDKVVQSANRGKSILGRFKANMTTDDRVELIQRRWMRCSMHLLKIENRWETWLELHFHRH